jgi:hypothetical protein
LHRVPTEFWKHRCTQQFPLPPTTTATTCSQLSRNFRRTTSFQHTTPSRLTTPPLITSAPPYPGPNSNFPTTEKPSPPPQQPGLGQNHVPPNPRGPNGRTAAPSLLTQYQPENNYSSQGSYGSHAQSNATNSLNIDPALLRLTQDGNQQPASNINFAPHSRPTFHFVQQNATQGSQSQQHQNTTPPPADDEKKTSADAYYMEALKDWTHYHSDDSDSSPGKVAYNFPMPTSVYQPFPMNSKGTYDAQPYPMNLKGAFDAQPFPHTNAVAGSKGDNDFPAFASYHSEKSAAPAHVPRAAIMDSSDDQSSDITGAT